MTYGFSAAALFALTALAAPAFAQVAPPVPVEQLLAPEQIGRPTTTPNAAAIAALGDAPKLVKPGKLVLATAAGSPPTTTFATDNATIVGADAEIAHLVAQALGLELELVAVAWADWPLGLAAGKYDGVISKVAVTEERKEKFDFSTYRVGQYAFFVPLASAVQSIAEPKDVAGLKVITDSGTIQERILLEWIRQNQEAGLPGTDVQYYDDAAVEEVALQSGRADVVFSPNGSLSWIARTLGTTRKVGQVNSGWPAHADIGIATRKGQGLAAPISLALNGVIAEGSYSVALNRWGFQDEALTESRVNPPGLPKY